MKNFLAGLGCLCGVGLLVAAQDEAPDEQTPLVKALERLAVAQERQAAAWEKISERKLPTPEIYEMKGNFPNRMTIDLGGDLNLSGLLNVAQAGNWSVSTF